MVVHGRQSIPALTDDSLRLAISDPLANVRRAVPLEVAADGDDGIAWRLHFPSLQGDAQRVELSNPDQRTTGFADGGNVRGTLTAFLKLADAPPEAVRTFALRWGTLGICEHDLPGVHGRCWPREMRPGPPGLGELWFLDDCEDYRKRARKFGAALRIVVAFRDGRRTDLADWRSLLGEIGEVAVNPAWWKDGKPYPTRILASWLTNEVANAGVMPRVSDDPGTKTFRLVLDLGGWAVPSQHDGSMPFLWPRGSLYSVLVAQLVAAIAEGDRLEECDMCHEVFDWADAGYDRRPQSGRGRYCSDGCRKGARFKSTNQYRRKMRDRAKAAAKGEGES